MSRTDTRVPEWYIFVHDDMDLADFFGFIGFGCSARLDKRLINTDTVSVAILHKRLAALCRAALLLLKDQD